jgi:chromosome segregation ATPase
MNISVKSAAESHADHRHWHSDVECWKDDIENWRAEHSAAIVQLQQALEQINENRASLDQHADAVASLERGLEYHEKHLAASLQSGSETELDKILSDRHAMQAGLYQRQREAHERIKKHHHTAMAQVAILKAALEAAM